MTRIVLEKQEYTLFLKNVISLQGSFSVNHLPNDSILIQQYNHMACVPINFLPTTDLMACAITTVYLL
jgi:hypothetical protein